MYESGKCVADLNVSNREKADRLVECLKDTLGHTPNSHSIITLDGSFTPYNKTWVWNTREKTWAEPVTSASIETYDRMPENLNF